MIREYPHFMLMTPDQKKVCVHLAQVIRALTTHEQSSALAAIEAAAEVVALRASEAAAVECSEALQAKLARTEIERDYDRRQTAHLQTVVDRLNAQLAAMTDSRDAAVARVG